jgi:flagellar protein FliO/FliZ
MFSHRVFAFLKTCLGARLMLLASALMFTTHVFSSETTSSNETLPKTLGSSAESTRLVTGQELDVTSSVIQVMLGLGVIILVIVLLAWVLKRVYRWQAPHQSMKVVSSLALGTRERALLIDVKGQQLLLGVTAQQVTLLKAFDEPIIPVDAQGKSSAFAEQLAEVIRSKKTPTASATSTSSAEENESKNDTTH